MTTPLNLLSWSRRGAGALPETGIGADGRRIVTPEIGLRVRHGDAAPATTAVPGAGISVLGAADCAGIDPERILRRYPAPGAAAHEPNMLATIEFDHADLPWLFSAAPRGDRPDPWLMLVVVRSAPDSEGTVQTRRGSTVLSIIDQGALPPPELAWAFAHVQVLGEGDPAATVAADPRAHGVRSRILCPTIMRPDSSYVAALVPVAAVTAARQTPGRPVEVYDHWTFRTGQDEDFEALARRLRRAPNSAALGQRTVAVEPVAALMQPDEPGAPPRFAPGVERVPTAIAKIVDSSARSNSPFAPNTPQPSERATALHARLRELIDLVAGAPDARPVVGPPLYGQWPAGTHTLDTQAPGHWVTQLNADPYQRIAAGVGAQIVAHDQESLMTEAWRQLTELEQANHRIRLSAVMAAAMTTVHAKLAAAPAAIQLRLTAASYGRVADTVGGPTVQARIRATTLPPQALGPAAMRIVTRAQRAVRTSSALAGPVGATEPPAVACAAVAEAFAAGSPAVLPRRFTAPITVDHERLTRVLAAPAFQGSVPATALTALADVASITDRVAARLERPRDDDVVPDADDILVRLHPALTEKITDKLPVHRLHPTLLDRLARQPDDLTSSAPAHELIGALAPHELVRLRHTAAPLSELSLQNDRVRITVGRALRPLPGTLLAATVTDHGAATALGAAEALRTSVLAEIGVTRIAAATALGRLGPADTAAFAAAARRRSEPVATPAGPAIARFDPAVTATVLAALAPEPAYRAMLDYAHTVVGATVIHTGATRFPQLRAAPEFPAPLVERLIAVDREWVLGGVGALPPDSVSLFGVNRRFLEALLAGANHAMATELIWRGYPTDPGGTSFRRFWRLPEPDVTEMRAWTTLGANRPTAAGTGGLSVVVIKGALLKRYPDTIISAVQGKPATGNRFTVTAEVPQLHRGSLGQDVVYSIFELDPARLADSGPAGSEWYISLRENTSETRFGLDDPPSGHLTAEQLGPSGTSAIAGKRLFQQPFWALLHAPDYIAR